jgi:hypothetical protein
MKSAAERQQMHSQAHQSSHSHILEAQVSRTWEALFVMIRIVDCPSRCRHTIWVSN